MIINAIPIIMLVVAIVASGISAWLIGGWLMDKYDAWRTDNWRGWK